LKADAFCLQYCVPPLHRGTVSPAAPWYRYRRRRGRHRGALDGALVAHHLGRVLPLLFLILYPTSDAVLAVALGRHSDRSVLHSDTPVLQYLSLSFSGEGL